MNISDRAFAMSITLPTADAHDSGRNAPLGQDLIAQRIDLRVFGSS